MTTTDLARNAILAQEVAGVVDLDVDLQTRGFVIGPEGVSRLDLERAKIHTVVDPEMGMVITYAITDVPLTSSEMLASKDAITAGSGSFHTFISNPQDSSASFRSSAKKIREILATYHEGLEKDTFVRIGGRLDTLLSAEEWKDDQFPDVTSFANMLTFLKKFSEFIPPRLSILRNGIFSIAWREVDKFLVRLDFYSKSVIRWMVLVPDSTRLPLIDQGSGQTTIDKVEGHLDPYDVLDRMRRGK